MLIVQVNQNIEKALKLLKSKVIKTRQNQKLNSKKEFVKKSEKKRTSKIKAEYIQTLKNQEQKLLLVFLDEHN
jgi:ribosomal protein S21